jgi:pyrroline-5-carboxylate reductase
MQLKITICEVCNMSATLQQLIPTLGFLGAGNMAGAILKGTVGRGLLAPQNAWACDVLPDKLATLHTELGIGTTQDPLELVRNARTIVLATKPQDLLAGLNRIAAEITPDHCLISIAAGLPLELLAAHLPAGTRLVRVMPNTPALVGAGAAGVAAGPSAHPEDLQAALALFSAVGLACEVREGQLDAVTAVSGSGPAYVFRMMELMIEAGKELGLSTEVAQQLTLQTFLGAARLAEASPETPATLRERVTSKGGTTAAALGVFEAQGLGEIYKAGIRQAAVRSRELAELARAAEQ